MDNVNIFYYLYDCNLTNRLIGGTLNASLQHRPISLKISEKGKKDECV